MVKNILLICFLFVAASIGAQTGFRQGYVIKIEGDTLYGEIDFQSEEQMLNICTFREKNSHNVCKYSPDLIAGYRFQDGKYFVSKEIDNKKIFLEFLIKGRVNIYFSTDSHSDHYYIEKDSFGLRELPYQETLKIKGNNEYLVKSNKHIGLLNYYMQDAPELKSKITDIKKPERDNLIQLAKNYHNAVCEGDKCIVFESKPPKFKMSLELLGGTLSVEKIIDSWGKVTDSPNQNGIAMGGLLAHFWMPSVSENLYIRTGLMSSGIPFQFEYVFPSKALIEPKIAIGIICPSIVPSAMAGINFKLNKKFYVSINYDVQIYSDYFIMPKGIMAQSLSAGINVIL